MATTLQRSSSAALFDKAQTLFPGGVNSPVRAFKSVGGTPLFVDKGQGAHIWDADGNEFISFIELVKKFYAKSAHVIKNKG